MNINKFIELNEVNSIITQYDPKLNKEEQTPFIHLYRAEIGRLVVYKQRLDTTIHWTFTINLFIWTLIFEFNDKKNIKKIILLKSISYLTIILFHLIDARRYISYDEVKRRCVLMEKGMYACILNENECYKDWKKDLAQTWLNPQLIKLSLIKSMTIRLRNIFIYIYITQTILFILNYLTI